MQYFFHQVYYVHVLHHFSISNLSRATKRCPASIAIWKIWHGHWWVVTCRWKSLGLWTKRTRGFQWIVENNDLHDEMEHDNHHVQFQLFWFNKRIILYSNPSHYVRFLFKHPQNQNPLSFNISKKCSTKKTSSRTFPPFLGSQPVSLVVGLRIRYVLPKNCWKSRPRCELEQKEPPYVKPTDPLQ